MVSFPLFALHVFGVNLLKEQHALKSWAILASDSLLKLLLCVFDALVFFPCDGDTQGCSQWNWLQCEWSPETLKWQWCCLPLKNLPESPAFTGLHVEKSQGRKCCLVNIMLCIYRHTQDLGLKRGKEKAAEARGQYQKRKGIILWLRDSGSDPWDSLPTSLLPQLSREGISSHQKDERKNTSFVQEGDRPGQLFSGCTAI